MKKLLLSTVFGVALGASSAMAADMAYPVKAPEIAIVPAYSWTGFYLGANVGYGWGDVDVWRGKYSEGALDYVDTWTENLDGWFAGGQVGYNYQFSNNVVVGIEADFQWSGMESRSSGFFQDGFDDIFATEKTSVEWFGTVRGRLGYAVDRVLFYGTGGLAYGNVEVSFLDEFGFGRSYSDTLWGWTAGGGVEWAFADNWSVKAEYLYVDLGSFSQRDFYVQLPNPWDLYHNRSTDVSFHTVKIGVNYKF